MVILHLINSFGDSSISRIVFRLVGHLGKQGYALHIGALNGTGDMRGEFNRLGALEVDFRGGKGETAESIRKIREYVTLHQVDIVHTHTPRTILMTLVALGMGRRPVHVATKHILNMPGDRRWGLLYSLLDRLLLYVPTHLVAVSRKVYGQITACPGLGEGRVSMIRNAIDCEPFHVPDQRDSCRSEFGLTPELVLIGTSGRLEKVKRYDLLLQGFSTAHARLPRLRLMIAGDGTLKHELEMLADELGIGHAVIWTGFRKDVPRLLAAMDIYIMSSVNEGLSLSILEAMAAGKPVIITDVGGARELVEDGKTGILIAPGSAAPIETAITELIDNPAKRAAVAQAGMEYVTREFGIGQMMESYRRLYETLTSQP